MNLKINNVFYRYKGSPKTVINGLNFTLNSRKIGLVGASGSGKSTLIHLLNGLKKPTHGQIEINDMIIDSNSDIRHLQALRKEVAIVYQFSDNQLFAESVHDELMFAIENFNIEIDNPLDDILNYFKLFNLEESLLKKQPHTLSGGQKKKITIITMLLIKPKLLVLDEPTVGLDPQSALEIMEAISQLTNAGLSVILISHDMNVIADFCDWIWEIQAGMKTYDGEIIDYFHWKYKIKQTLLLPTYLRYGGIIDEGDNHFSQLVNGEQLSDLIQVKNV